MLLNRKISDNRRNALYQAALSMLQRMPPADRVNLHQAICTISESVRLSLDEFQRLLEAEWSLPSGPDPHDVYELLMSPEEGEAYCQNLWNMIPLETLQQLSVMTRQCQDNS